MERIININIVKTKQSELDIIVSQGLLLHVKRKITSDRCGTNASYKQSSLDLVR